MAHLNRARPIVALLNLRLANSPPIVPTLRSMASVAPSRSAEADQTSLHDKVKAKQEAKKKADVPLGMLKADGTSKRFYKSAGISEIFENDPRSGALRRVWGMTLDGRMVRTPANKLLALPTQAMAMAVALEFDVQDANILPYTMPLTTLATTAIDQMSRPDVRAHAVKGMLRHLAHDLVCLRSAEPEDLVARESAVWGAVCDWAARAYGCSVRTTNEWLQFDQDEALTAAVEADLRGRHDWRLAAIDQVAGSTGSLLVSLAMAHGALNGPAAFEAARLPEDYQVSRWGKVETCGVGGHDLDASDMRARLAAAHVFHRLLPADER